MWWLRTFLLAWVALPLAVSAGEPRRLAQYVHQRWIGSEAPMPVLAMAQGRDGFLWLATGDGLFRFDGVRFEHIEEQGNGQKHELPSALLVTGNGDVWTNFETSRRFAVYRNGVLHILDAPAAPQRIIEMAEGRDGAIWAMTANYDAELLRFRDGQWRTFTAADGLPRSNSTNLIVAADGAVWVACSTAVARLAPGAERFEIIGQMPRGTLSQDPAGRVWMTDEAGSYPITGPGGQGAPERLREPHRTRDTQTGGAPLFDREGNLWIGTRFDGLKRLSRPGATADSTPAVTESFTSRDGLSSDVTNQVMEDEEGNLWVATEAGLDKFRPATLIAEATLGAPAAFGDKLLEASDGSVYIGQTQTVYRVRPGGMPEPILRDVVEPESLCEAPDGAIWIGFRTQILVWADGGVRETIERPDNGASHNFIYDCAFDMHGDFWMSAAGSGVHRYSVRRDAGGQWETMLPPGDQVDAYPTTMVRTPRGVVVQTGDRLAWLEDSNRSFTPLDVGDSGPHVLTLYAVADEVFAAGAFGLSRYRGGRSETAWATDASGGARISGVVQMPDGDTWLAYPRSLVRLRPDELERAFSNGVLSAPNLSLGAGDGLKSRAHSHSQRTLVRGGDGRVWVATETGTLWMDPSRLVRNEVPPNVVIRSLSGDDRSYRDPAAVTLAPATANIEIGFAVLSFADPGRVHVRYRLEGFDRSWVDPGLRRQAFYTNLPPGKYTFRVIAANNDGVWNRVGSAVDIEIPPSFVQSIWFLLLCSVLAIALLWLVYRVRVAQVAGRIRSRLEERIAERERIARELHDTLLQGVQGLILRFQAVADRVVGDEKAKDQLETALTEAQQVVVQARNQVHDLRDREGMDDLCVTVERLVAETPFAGNVPVRILVEGRPRPLQPLVAAEVARIVREALLNIAHHAQATSAQIGIGFEARYLAIRMRDDGVGIPEDVLAHGHKDGHFGMIGMRERAERIGGTLTISSSPSGGAEVTLTLPAKLAFAKRKSRGRAFWARIMAKGHTDE